MRSRGLFLAAYACSGLAALIYEVSWTRLLTLHMGHSTAAASTVVASFMGGLAIGAAVGGRVAPRLTLRQALFAYVGLECFVGLIAVLVPYEFALLTPLLNWAYRDGAGGILFSASRLLSCLALLTVPAVALGATFPLAVRCYVTARRHPGRAGGALYAVNTMGAAVGALAAGFALVPAMGVRATTLVGVAASGLTAVLVLLVARSSGPDPIEEAPADPAPRTKTKTKTKTPPPEPVERPWLAPLAVGVSGFAALLFEIVWTRILALIVGPTTYAFSATVAVFIAGTAGGAALGSWVAGRTRRPALWLAVTLIAAAVAANWASSLAGSYLPLLTVRQLSESPEAFSRQLPWHALMAAALILPLAAAAGAAFPLALNMVSGQKRSAAHAFSVVYAVNTLAAVAGSLVAGFVIIPWLGLQQTMRAVSALLVLDGVVVALWGRLSPTGRGVAFAGSAVAAMTLLWSPPWDRELLASGIYRYAPYVDKGLDVESSLKAGTLLYYRDGAASTVSVKELTGSRSLAIDGKVDASNSGDMLTQKLLAHLPLLLHPDPHDVGIIGLGSGVTLASALVHAIARADVAEISPEVVEASRYFAADNGNALDDPRTHLIVGDGRSHLLLSDRKYDVIISEPSNPWMAGVAALFTREFFTAAKNRLAPGGIICQWAHTYDISDSDLRSIAATFSSVFPDGTIWLIGEGDVLFVASAGPLDSHLAGLEHTWRRPGVADDLKKVSALEPFALWSLFVGGPQELGRYGSGAAIQRDDRMALEFSGPRSLFSGSSSDNAATLRKLLDPQQGPPAIRRARATAGGAEWRNRGRMLFTAREYGAAYDSYTTAFGLQPTDRATLEGLVQTAIALHREAQTQALFRTSLRAHPESREIWTALSKLLAASGSAEEAIEAARRACDIQPPQPAALEQLASIYADLGDADQLAPVVERLQEIQPVGAATFYYGAALRFIRGQFPEALDSLRQAIRLNPSYAAAENMIGAIHATLGQYQPAKDALLRALQLNAEDSATYTNLGLLELGAGNRSAAAGYYAEALSLDPKSETARQGLAQAQ